MALGTFVAGRYSCTYNAVDFGIAEKGYNLSWTVFKDKINNTDQYGDSDIDAVYRGMNVFMETTAKEYKAGSLTPVTPYSVWAPTGTVEFGMGLIGRLDTNVASILILTATASTPAASAPATLTATYAILDAGFNVNIFFGPEHRKVPVKWQFYPYLSTTVKYFTAT